MVYDPNSSPTDGGMGGKTAVIFDFTIYGLSEVNTIEGYAVIKGELSLMWNDTRLDWSG